jgi:deoxyadenosine/deoxycytidine kinase
MKIVIDGNIGSGKTTQLNLLIKYYPAVHKEPIEKWPLDLFYSDPKRWGFLLQIRILQTFYEQANISGIFERCPMSSKHVFWEDSEKTEIEDIVYNDQFNIMAWKPDIYILIHTPPKICLEHIQNRIQEGDSYVKLEYLEHLDTKYKSLYSNVIDCPKYIVDGTNSPEDINKQIRYIIDNYGNL